MRAVEDARRSAAQDQDDRDRSEEEASAQQKVSAHHALKPTVEREHLVEQATRAPLIRFYDDWNEKSGMAASFPFER